MRNNENYIYLYKFTYTSIFQQKRASHKQLKMVSDLTTMFHVVAISSLQYFPQSLLFYFCLECTFKWIYGRYPHKDEGNQDLHPVAILEYQKSRKIIA